MVKKFGINPKEIDLDKLNYITKMRYRARADKKWVEYEIDYIFAIKCDVGINPNQIEIEDTKYVDSDELDSIFQDGKSRIGPWFRIIKEKFLDDIWKSIDSLEVAGDTKLHHMGDCE